ncbi:unnamed protein product [Aphis gossypii]|uniref:T-ag OBD domain-containing protein n=1 Tax=Aphis gossypii TaxID=80765 RepID=A0A9P0NJG1_APHGO|nr:unnamed protein product [Aphis gossypii]
MVIICENIILPRSIVQYLPAAVASKKVQGQHIIFMIVEKDSPIFE